MKVADTVPQWTLQVPTRPLRVRGRGLLDFGKGMGAAVASAVKTPTDSRARARASDSASERAAMISPCFPRARHRDHEGGQRGSDAGGASRPGAQTMRWASDRPAQ